MCDNVRSSTILCYSMLQHVIASCILIQCAIICDGILEYAAQTMGPAPWGYPANASSTFRYPVIAPIMRTPYDNREDAHAILESRTVSIPKDYPRLGHVAWSRIMVTS